jgi:hypothetical protein
MPRIARIEVFPLSVSVGPDRALGNARGRYDRAAASS